MIREDFLQQNAFLENDQYSSFDRQARLLDLILRYKDLCDAAIERGADIWKLYAIAARAQPSAVRRPFRRTRIRTFTRRSYPIWSSRSKKLQRRLRLNDPRIPYHP